MVLNNRHKDFLMRNIDIINDILDTRYGSPNHGNKTDPLDELVYIHLSKKTNEKGYVKAFNQLSVSFPGWQGLAEADPEQIKKLISSAGLGENRTEELLSNIKIIKGKFKRESLDEIKNWTDKKIFRFLTELKGIGPKSARCIMMYSLERRVFPVDTHVHTICERLGFIEESLNHKIAQERLAELFPEDYRYSLHVNMVAHGRKICRERGKTSCDICDLNKFCLFFRKKKRGSIGKPKMIDLFCGPGGASLGFSNAGFAIKLAIDNDTAAIDTYYLNHPELTFDGMVDRDIKNFDHQSASGLANDDIDLIIGGPPCQGWSSIGKNWKNGNNGKDFLNDERNILYKEFVRQLNNFRPKYFVMENVPGLLTAHNGKYAKIIHKGFFKHGYKSKMVKLNAVNYGIPQNRTRIFFIGRKIEESEGEVNAENELERIIELIDQKVIDDQYSFREAIRGLPHVGPGEGANVMRLDITRLQGIHEDICQDDDRLVFNHFSRGHNPRDLKIYHSLSEGENYYSFSKRTKKKDLLPYSNRSFHTKFRKIIGDKPCYTIISHLHKDANSYIHPDDNRGITVREAARIQSFPDDFIFLAKGFRQFIHVGNAVPPRLAEIIGESIIEVMNRGGK